MQWLQTETHFALLEALNSCAEIGLLVKRSCSFCLEIGKEPSGKYFVY